MSAKATLKLSVAAAVLASAILNTQPKWDGQLSLEKQFTDGVTADKIDLVYMAERTVGDGANDDIDLAGALSDALGNTITAAEIVAIVIINKSTNTTALTIGGATNAYAGFLGGTSPTVGPIGPGGCFCIMSPDATGLGAVTGGSEDELRVANAAGAANTYQIAILARSS